jgi:hypothetical protein
MTSIAQIIIKQVSTADIQSPPVYIGESGKAVFIIAARRRPGPLQVKMFYPSGGMRGRSTGL